MTPFLSGGTVLQASRLCVARPQKDSYLFYHYRTDELHLVPPVGYYVFRLCDGLRSVSEIEQLLANGTKGGKPGADTPATVRQFLENLLARGILEVSDG